MNRFLLLVVLGQCALLCACTNEFLSKTRKWGSSSFFAVKRDKLQERLEEISIRHGSQGSRFHLPTEPVMQDVIGSDEHVIMIAFGNAEAVSFSDVIGSHDTCTTTSKVANIIVPFISTTANGEADMSLLLKTYRSENGGKIIIDANAIVPTDIDHVDDLVIRDDFFLLVDGEQRLVIKERTSAAGCSSSPVEAVWAVTQVERTLLTSFTPPDFGVCLEHLDLQVDFCDFYRAHAEEIAAAGNDVCEYLRPSADAVQCSAKFDIVSISDAMRDALLLGEDVRESVAGTYQHGTYAVYIKVPCSAQQQLVRQEFAERRRFFNFS